MKILIVDDDKSILRLYQDSFEDEGHTVVTAASGGEALEIFDREGFDIVTLDINMPGMDGIEVLRRMKEKKKDIPVILLTAYDYRDDFSVWGCDEYVMKSSDIAELKSAITKLLEAKAQE